MNIKKINEKQKIPQKFTNTILKTSDKLYSSNNGRNYKFIKTLTAACACAVLTTGIVFAKDISSYVSQIFNLGSKGYGDKILTESLENNMHQTIDEKYISANDINYKLSYLLIDDINIMLAIDFQTNFNINEYEGLAFNNLKILDENGNQISVDSELQEIHSKNLAKNINCYTIEKTDYSISEDIILTGLEKSFNGKKLNISFDGIKLYSVNNSNVKSKDIKDNFNIVVDVDEKLNNSQATYYKPTPIGKTSYTNIDNVILTKTGLGITVSCDELFDIVIKGSNGEEIYYKVNSLVETKIKDGNPEQYLAWIDIDKEQEIFNIELKIKDNGQNYLSTETYMIQK